MINTVDKVINVALSQVGYLEKSCDAYKADPTVLYKMTEGAGSHNYTKYGKEMHDIYPTIMDFPAAWCDAFVDWCFYQAYGITTAKSLLCGNFDDYTVSSAQMYKNKSAYYRSDPKVGDQIFFKNGSGICHTGLVYAVDDNYVYTVEGNSSNLTPNVIANGGAVVKKQYTKNYEKIDGYGRPKYDTNDTAYPMWVSDGENWYYRLSAGVNAHGWRIINSHWYYFDNLGKALKGLQTIEGNRYFFETSGDLECALMKTDELGRLTEWKVKGVSTPETTQEVQGVKTESNEMSDKEAFDYFKSEGLTDAGVAGLMGNLYAESGMKSTALQNTYKNKLGMTDTQYTASVDNGSYKNFIYDTAGYGLAQWTYYTRKEALLNFVKKAGTSIGDKKSQCEFLIKELKEYKRVFEILCAAKSVQEASDVVLLEFEKPADQSDAIKARRTLLGQNYFAKYALRGDTLECPFTARVIISDLYIRQEPYIGSKAIGLTGKGTFTIVEVKDGWGKLQQGTGWIYIKNANYVSLTS